MLKLGQCAVAVLDIMMSQENENRTNTRKVQGIKCTSDNREESRPTHNFYRLYLRADQGSRSKFPQT